MADNEEEYPSICHVDVWRGKAADQDADSKPNICLDMRAINVSKEVLAHRVRRVLLTGYIVASENNGTDLSLGDFILWCLAQGHQEGW